MEMVQKEYASKGVAGAGLGTGIAGLSLAALNSGIFNGGLFGNRTAACYEQTHVTQSESVLRAENEKLKSEKYTDNKVQELYNFIYAETKERDQAFVAYREQVASKFETQAVYNAKNTAAISCLTKQVNEIDALLSSITKTAVPANVICDFNNCNC